MRVPRSLSLKPFQSGGRWWLYVGEHKAEGAKSDRETFATKKEAQARAKQIRVKLANHGTAGAMLSLEAQLDAAKAAEILEGVPDPPSLADLARAEVERREREAHSIAFGDLCDLYRQTKDLSAAKGREYERLGKRFAGHFPGSTQAITVQAIDAALDAETAGLTSASRKHYRALISIGNVRRVYSVR